MLILTDIPLGARFRGSPAVEAVNVNQLNLHHCIGCFTCWLKTPGRCVFQDDQETLNPRIASCDRLVLVSRVRYGCFDVPMKQVLERTLPLQQPFLCIRGGETHHAVRPCFRPKEALLLGYGAEDRESEDIFRELGGRLARNLCFASLRVAFTTRENAAADLEREGCLP